MVALPVYQHAKSVWPQAETTPALHSPIVAGKRGLLGQMIERQVDLVEHRSDGLLVEHQVEHGSDLRPTSGQESRISSTTKAASEPLNAFLSRIDEMSWTRTTELTGISSLPG